MALLDSPSYENAGDALIWQGQRQYLQELGHEVSYVASQGSFSSTDLRRRCPEGPLLITGGGNLGDRYPTHQEFRETVIRTFPDRPVVQLPQSIEFRDAARLKAARKIFDSHPDLTLLMRDRRSLETARAAFPDTRVEFCPDAAYGVGRLERSREAEVDVLLLLRRDTERVGRTFEFPDGVSHATTDWSFPPGLGRVLWKLLRQPENRLQGRPTREQAYHLLRLCSEGMVRGNVHFARRTLARGRVVITDRLHAMVLASLSGIPVVALDNNYGKISAVHREYGGALRDTHFVTSADAAVRCALSYLSSGS